MTRLFAICRLSCRNARFTRAIRSDCWGPGALDICDPFGIGVIFEGERPLRVENLEFRGEY
ncbi:MAG: hypothetical protein ACLVCW_03265 [Campylobacter sp.]